VCLLERVARGLDVDAVLLLELRRVPTPNRTPDLVIRLQPHSHACPKRIAVTNANATQAHPRVSAPLQI
jgi:hypothetical protein